MKLLHKLCTAIQNQNQSLPVLKSINNNQNIVAFGKYMPKQWKAEDYINYFDPNKSIFNKVQILYDRLGKPTGNVIFHFIDSEVCKEFTQKNQSTHIETEDILQEVSIEPFQLKRKSTKLLFERNNNHVYIYNLDYKMKNIDIWEIAQHFGKIQSIQLPLNNDKTLNKGYAMIKFSKQSSARIFQDYILHHKINGRKLAVQLKNFKFDTQQEQERLTNLQPYKWTETTLMQESKILLQNLQNQHY